MTATDDDKEFAAELGFMTALADAALESLGRPEDGDLGELGELISDLAQLADTAHMKVAPPIVDHLTAAVAAGDDFRSAARAAVHALVGALQPQLPEPPERPEGVVA